MFGATATRDLVTNHIPIHQFQKGRPENVLAVSVLEGVYTHFDGRSRVCAGKGYCRLCEIGRDRRYLGYFAAMLGEQRILVRLTAEAALRCTAHPPKPGVVYRVESVGSRRPLQVSPIGHAKVTPEQMLSQKELLKVLFAIHGLGILPSDLSYEEVIEDARDRAKLLIDRECVL